MENENYTYDYIHGTDVYLYQRKDMFRTNTDTALLAHFMNIQKGDQVLDIGTNNGALLMAASRKGASRLIGVEIQKEAVKLAQYNLGQQPCDFEIMHGDVCQLKLPKVDVVVCNPPYFKVSENSNLNDSSALATARHERFLTLPQLAMKMSEALNEKGRGYLVHRASRIAEIITVFMNERLQVRSLQFIYDEAKEEAVSVLLEVVKDGNVNCHVLPPQNISR